MRFTETELRGCFIVDIEPIEDDRGFFARRFCAREFEEHGLAREFVQSSISYNAVNGTLRGLHFELAGHMEEKLVSCLGGAIFDVAVDVRPDSPTFSRWIGMELSAANYRMLYLPKGFAHGFLTLAPKSVVSYQIAQFYEAGHSAGIRWDDPDIGIIWPVAPSKMSARDVGLPLLSDVASDDLLQKVTTDENP